MRLRLAVQRIERSPTVMTDVGKEPSTLLLDDRLVRRAALQVMKAHQHHISGLRRTSRDGLRRAGASTTQQQNRESEVQNDGAQPLRHFDSLSSVGGSLPSLFDTIRHPLPAHIGAAPPTGEPRAHSQQTLRQ
jgi:hypothetical protein